jgi:membrane protease YdiL (CAAX protease family)
MCEEDGQMKALIERHPLATYVGLAFAITWGAILALVAPLGIPGRDIRFETVGLIFLAMVAGPSTSSLVLTEFIDGRAGLRSLFGRMRRWRASSGWYALALGTMPLLVLAILVALRLFVSPVFAPGFNALGIVVGLAAGFFEEIGWTGFALPRLRVRHGAMTAGLLLGLIWGLWHGFADYWGRADSFGSLWLPVFLVFVASVTAYRMLMACVYERTQSLRLAQLMHACYTGSLALFGPTTSHADEVLWNALVAAALWTIVGVVALVRRRRSISRRQRAPATI